MKALIGITASESELEILQPGDEIMADKGFLI